LGFETKKGSKGEGKITDGVQTEYSKRITLLKQLNGHGLWLL